MKERKGWVDAFKGIGMLMVILAHSGFEQLGGFIHRIGLIGRTGVSIFFMISIYLGLVSYEKLENKNGKLTIKWAVSKIIKLLGLYYFFIIIYAIMTGGMETWLGNDNNITIGNYLTHIFLVNSFFPLYINSILGVEWYLSILFVVYFLIPLIYKYIDTIDKGIVFLIASLFLQSYLGRFIGFIPECENKFIYESYFKWMSLWANLPSIALGSIIYNYEKKQFVLSIKRKKILSLSMLLWGIFMFYGILYNYTTVFCLSSEIIYTFVYFIIIFSQILFENKIINNGVFKFIGKNSYPIYLIHFILFQIYDKYVKEYDNLTLGWLIKVMVVILFSSGFAVLYYKTKNNITNWWNKKHNLEALK